MYREFAEVLEQHADHTVMLDVYGAREDPVPGVTGELVSRRVRRSGARALRRRLAGGRRLHRDRRPRRRLRHHPRLRQRVPDHPAGARARSRAPTAPPADAAASAGGVARMRRPSPLPPPPADRAIAPALPRRPRTRSGSATPATTSSRDPSSAVGATTLRRRATPTAPVIPLTLADADAAARPRCPTTRRPPAPRRAGAGADAGADRPPRRLARAARPPQGAARRGAPLHGAPATPARAVARGRGIRRPPRARHARRRLQPAVRASSRSRVVGARAARRGRRRGGAGGPAAARRCRSSTRAPSRPRSSTFPLVESYTLEARPPHELVVRIVERTPIGLIETRAGYTLVDAAGVALSTTATPRAGRAAAHDRRAAPTRAAFEAVGQVMRSLPEAIRAQVTAVAASTPDDVTLTLGGTNTQVVWGSADESAMKAVVLETIMAARPPADVSVYDVSSPTRRSSSAERRPDRVRGGMSRHAHDAPAEARHPLTFDVKELHTGQFFIPLLEVEGFRPGSDRRRPA